MNAAAPPPPSPPSPVEVIREESASGTVFVATPGIHPRIRTRHLLAAGLVAVGLIVAAGLVPGDHVARMLRWLAALCVVPVLVLWVVLLTETVRRRAVRLGVTKAGLTVDGSRIYRHETIRDLTLYPMIGGRPLFVVWIEPSRAYGHKAEMELVAGGVAPDAVKAALREAGGSGVRLVLHRRDGQKGIVLVRGLSLSSGESLLAALAAELRPHSR